MKHAIKAFFYPIVIISKNPKYEGLRLPLKTEL